MKQFLIIIVIAVAIEAGFAIYFVSTGVDPVIAPTNTGYLQKMYPTATPSESPSASPTPTPKRLIGSTATHTPTPSAQPNRTPTPTPTASATPVATPTPSPTPSITPQSTPSPTPVVTPTPSPTPIGSIGCSSAYGSSKIRCSSIFAYSEMKIVQISFHINNSYRIITIKNNSGEVVFEQPMTYPVVRTVTVEFMVFPDGVSMDVASYESSASGTDIVIDSVDWNK